MLSNILETGEDVCCGAIENWTDRWCYWEYIYIYIYIYIDLVD